MNIWDILATEQSDSPSSQAGRDKVWDTACQEAVGGVYSKSLVGHATETELCLESLRRPQTGMLMYLHARQGGEGPWHLPGI